MRYRDARAFRMALEQRLNTGAGGDGARLPRDRKRVVFDRLLARLTATAPDRWLLKGGFALELRLAERARATKDVDLDWLAAEEELLDALLDAAAHDV
ncbi:MAG: nucleotidyl transferase AbiEii/AbiGii toxin family protein, partial [Thermoleophilaceae bacterium]